MDSGSGRSASNGAAVAACLTPAEIAGWGPASVQADPYAPLRGILQRHGLFGPSQIAGRHWPVGCVALEITQRCNLDCRLCYLSDHAEAVHDLPLAEVFRRIELIERHYGRDVNVQVSGGDPTLRARHELVAIVGQLQADTGRGVWRRADPGLTQEAVIAQIEQGAGIPLGFDQAQIGHPACNRYASCLVAGGVVAPLLDYPDFTAEVLARTAGQTFDRHDRRRLLGVFMAMTRDGPVSMCIQNARRDAFVLQPVRMDRDGRAVWWDPLRGWTPDQSATPTPDPGRYPPKRLKGRLRARVLAERAARH